MIFIPAYFWTDETKKIGQIRYSPSRDTCDSMFFITKNQALEIARSQIGINLDEDEYRSIIEQVHASELIDSNENLERIFADFQGDIDELARLLENISR